MKKNPREYEELTEQFFKGIKEKGCDERFCHYVWDVQIALSRGYGFNASHTLAYSIIALQEMNLAYKYPIVYWNTANLIVDSGGIQTIDYEEVEDEMIEVELSADDDVVPENENDEEELEEWEEANDTLNEDTEDKKKKKQKNIDYGRVASIIGKLNSYGIKVSPPDINNSSFTFTPIATSNTILYGLRGITGIAGDKITRIMEQRPYSSVQDCINKNHLNKTQVVNLIKSGAFDEVEKKSREEIMHDYIDLISDKKQRLTLQNMQMLINKELIPDEMVFYARLFLFNKFLKTQKDTVNYKLNDSAITFIDDNFNADLVNNGEFVAQKTWDNLYKKAMEPMRKYLKEHEDDVLKQLNQSLYDELADKYAKGTISKWEMDSISFYYHDHELLNAAYRYDDFFELPDEPEIEYIAHGKDGQEYKIYKIHRIIGTVIDKDKMHNTVTLLTPTGVVLVKVYKNQFAIYDKQLSQHGADGKKHVIEKSWFTRGTMLMIQGVRRGNDFIPKKKKQSLYPVISKITHINNDGTLQFQFEREEVE